MIAPSVIVAFAFAGAAFLVVLLTMSAIGRLVRGAAVEYHEKQRPYECGELPIGNAWIRFNPRFLILAVVFVLFDIEVAFLFPWAVAYPGAISSKALGMIAFVDMLVFVVILLVGYLWFWKLGELRWIMPREAATISPPEAAPKQ